MAWKKHVCGFGGIGPVHIARYNLVAMSHAKSSASAPTVCPISFNPEQYLVAKNVQGGTVEVCLVVEKNCYGDFSEILQTGNKCTRSFDIYHNTTGLVKCPCVRV